MISSRILYFARLHSVLCGLQSLFSALFGDHLFLTVIPAFFVAIMYVFFPHVFLKTTCLCFLEPNCFSLSRLSWWPMDFRFCCTCAFLWLIQLSHHHHHHHHLFYSVQDLNEAHGTFTELHSKFFGLPHMFAVLKLVGSRSLPWLVHALLDYLSQKVLTWKNI